MELKDRINAFAQLGSQLKGWLKQRSQGELSEVDTIIESARFRNGWFTDDQVSQALEEVSDWLTQDALEAWTRVYDFNSSMEVKQVGVIMAGNIPLVGFHDYLSVLMSGHKILAKLSSKDEVLIQFLNKKLIEIDARFEPFVDFSTERFNKVDAVIATGSDNSSRYFDYYFSNKPNIIRKNRTSIAVLSGKENEEELKHLGEDIFRYYGLGCRNITKVYLPKGFDIDWFYKGIISHSEVINNHKYQNNYDYHKSIFLLNRDKFWDNNFLLLKAESAISSPVGTLYFEEYSDLEILEKELSSLADQIQCRVGVGGEKLGAAQKPNLSDYSDNIDVLKFLLGL